MTMTDDHGMTMGTIMVTATTTTAITKLKCWAAAIQGYFFLCLQKSFTPRFFLPFHEFHPPVLGPGFVAGIRRHRRIQSATERI